MSQRIPKILVFQGADGQWYWHLKSSNGKIVAAGEGYKTSGGAKGGASALKRLASMATIVKASPSP